MEMSGSVSHAHAHACGLRVSQIGQVEMLQWETFSFWLEVKSVSIGFVFHIIHNGGTRIEAC